MKKGFLVVLLFALISSLPSQENLKKLNGIWEGRDRFVFFENAADDENPFFKKKKKTYYGWYYDRAAENSMALGTDYYAVGLIHLKGNPTANDKTQALNAFNHSADIFTSIKETDLAKRSRDAAEELK